MGREDYVIAAALAALSEHGQAVRQFITQTLDGNPDAPADIVFAPNDPNGSVVCAEVRLTLAPTLDSSSVDAVLRHKAKIEQVNPGVRFVLATNADIVGRAREVAQEAGLVVLPVDLENPHALAFALMLVSMGN